MKLFICLSVLLGWSFASSAFADLPELWPGASSGIITSQGIRYRVYSSNFDTETPFILDPIVDPEAAADSGLTASPKQVEILRRCDELVADALRMIPGEKPPFSRDRIDSLGRGRAWVIYSQRHQGYPVISGSARLELDEHGRIARAWLTYEAAKLPSFRPKAEDKLQKIARAAVPYRITGEPKVMEFMVQPPRGEGWGPVAPASHGRQPEFKYRRYLPAQMLYYIVYPVQDNGHHEMCTSPYTWRITLDAVASKVIDARP